MKLLSLIRNPRALAERLRFKYTPRLTNWVVDLSTRRARSTLQKSEPIAVLIDNTILSHVVTHETGWISTGVKKWGTHDIETGYAARIPVHAAEDDSIEYRNIKYLPGIACLARRGLIVLRTSAELGDERFRQPVGRFGGYGYFDYSVFSDVPMESVDGHVFPSMGPSYFRLPSAVEQQRARLNDADDPLYRSLVEQLGPSNSQDAWHIRTAEIHGFFCFLTMDFRLLRTIESKRGSEVLKSLRTRVMTPLEFGEHFGLMPVPPNILSYNDASFFVRPDLSWPESKRRPSKSYRKDGHGR